MKAPATVRKNARFMPAWGRHAVEGRSGVARSVGEEDGCVTSRGRRQAYESRPVVAAVRPARPVTTVDAVIASVTPPANQLSALKPANRQKYSYPRLRSPCLPAKENSYPGRNSHACSATSVTKNALSARVVLSRRVLCVPPVIRESSQRYALSVTGWVARLSFIQRI